MAALVGTGVLSSCGSTSHSTGSTALAGVQGPSEVAAQPVSSAGADPFTSPVGMDMSGVMPPAATAASQAGGLPSYNASLPGLYGGTLNHASCDAAKLVSFLQHNPNKASAWAGALGIQTSEISSYVSGLTPVLLRTDTRVTNHGFLNGVANPIPAVLEAGTAVFVDKYGRPVVKCYCGNPLTPPELLPNPTYTGPTWQGFDPGHITIINQSTTIINTYTLYDPSTGQLFKRTAGMNGTDVLINRAPSTNTPLPPASSTPQPQPPSTQSTQQSAPQQISCPSGEVPDPSSSDGCSPQTPSCPSGEVPDPSSSDGCSPVSTSQTDTSGASTQSQQTDTSGQSASSTATP